MPKEKQSEGTLGTYAVYFPEDISLDDMQKLVVELLDNNKNMTIDIRTSHDITKIFEEGIVVGAVFNWLTKDGRVITVELNSSLLKDNEGNVTGAVASIRDVTERKKREEDFIKIKTFWIRVFYCHNKFCSEGYSI